MSKARDQGTRYETAIVNKLNEWARQHLDTATFAKRLAEQGTNDQGDIELDLGRHRLPLVVEAKHRQALNLHQTVAAANHKAGAAFSVVFWKKLTRKDGASRRTPDGVAEIVAMDVDTFLWLLDGMP